MSSRGQGAPLSDERLEQIIGTLLRAGVLLAAGVVLAGGIRYLIAHAAEQPHYSVFHGQPPQHRSVRGILTGIASLQGRSIIQFGLLILMATPVARVAFAVVAFALQRDRTYVVVTLIVLGVLLFSLAGGQ